MSRVSRVVIPGYPHHVTQRGNRKTAIFSNDEDRRAYLRLLRRYGERYGVAVWAYCLMTNHVHLILVPAKENALGLALRDTHTVYARHFNTQNDESGHVWQGRFYSCPLDDAHLWAAVRYVERNPVRAGMVSRAEDYPWSSAQAHCGLHGDPVLMKDFPPKGYIEDWKHWLALEEDTDKVSLLRHNTHTGRPCGAPDFLAHIESILGRVVRPDKRGRKLGWRKDGAPAHDEAKPGIKRAARH